MSVLVSANDRLQYCGRRWMRSSRILLETRPLGQSAVKPYLDSPADGLAVLTAAYTETSNRSPHGLLFMAAWAAWFGDADQAFVLALGGPVAAEGVNLARLVAGFRRSSTQGGAR